MVPRDQKIEMEYIFDSQKRVQRSTAFKAEKEYIIFGTEEEEGHFSLRCL